MDPLSLTASIIAVVGAGSKIGKGLKKLVAARHMPDIVLALNNEVSDLRCVVHDLDDLLWQHDQVAHEDRGPLPGHASLSSALKHAKETLLALKSLIAYELTTVDSTNGHIKMDWSSWLRAEAKAQKLKDDIHTDRVRLSSALSLLASSTSLGLQIPMRKLHVTMETLEAQVGQTNGALAGQMQMMTGLISNILELNHRDHTIPGVRRSAAEIHPSSDSLVIPQSPSHLGHDHYRTPQPGFASSQATTFDLTLSSCGLKCTCTCHKRTRFRSPQFLNSIIGSLFLGYNASPLLGQRCNKEYCRSPSTDVTYTYAFPRWFVDRVVVFKMSSNLPKGPELCIRLARMRPRNADIFAAAVEHSDDVRHVERLLLTGGASVLDIDPTGVTALQYALSSNNFKVVELLLKAGSDSSQEDFQGSSPYILAWGSILSSSGPSMNLTRLSNLFHDRSQLISFDFPELLSAYLGLSGRTFDSILSLTPRPAIDLVDVSGRTTLSWAAQRGDYEAMKQLLGCGADPNHADMSGKTPLHWSLFNDDNECVQILLAAKANVDAKDWVGSTALDHAVHMYDDAGMTEMLLSYNSDIESMSNDGRRPLRYAVRSNRTKNLSLLLHRGVNINAVDSRGDTALIDGIFYNSHEVMGILLKQKTLEYGGKGYCERTVLHHAALYADLETIALLESANLRNIDTMAREMDGNTALDDAVWRRDWNESWSNWALKAPDEDPLKWFAAFEALLDGIVERQQNLSGEETNEDEEEQEDWEENSSDEKATEDEEEQEDWEEDPSDEETTEDEEEQEVWEDATESVHTSSE